MPEISIPSKGATGNLSRRAKSFAPSGTGGFELLNITVNWEPGQKSGPVSFSFTLNQPFKKFPAGTYSFAGHVATDEDPCLDPNSSACGLVSWPGPGQDEVDWQSTGGPVPGDEVEQTEVEEDTEENTGESEDTEEPSAGTESPYGK